MYLNRIALGNLIQVCSFKGCAELLITNAPCQVYLPAALAPSAAGGLMPAETSRNQELCSFNSNATMLLKITSSLPIPRCPKGLGNKYFSDSE